MREELVATIERLTGAKVVALMSANHLKPDTAAEIFILDRPVPGQPSPTIAQYLKPTAAGAAVRAVPAPGRRQADA